jgi:hypothetical protein
LENRNGVGVSSIERSSEASAKLRIILRRKRAALRANAKKACPPAAGAGCRASEASAKQLAYLRRNQAAWVASAHPNRALGGAHPNLAGNRATSPAEGRFRGLSPRQPRCVSFCDGSLLLSERSEREEGSPFYSGSRLLLERAQRRRFLLQRQRATSIYAIALGAFPPSPPRPHAISPPPPRCYLGTTSRTPSRKSGPWSSTS